MGSTAMKRSWPRPRSGAQASTGKPKGAQLSHGNLAANALQVDAWAPDLPARNASLLVRPA